jgi:cobalamin biosynthesis Mg chelatase CobN
MMAEKKGPEKTELVKEEHDGKEEYIFQKNPKTKTGTYIIIAFLVILVVAIIVSAIYFGMPGS